ncbi:ArsR/SmtB family transcription factor [Streptomyces marispadix]|uniref:Metalloregulator ArsR/SmtB family transcription factor n=1 Tax=Streptomyces marispadix TaxID=2922868 RepID=A0ABS9SUT0_9ACTN|nr:metalloregulator ArsR/SmtB family transcription factor [Streptomyces marispadix]MCH6160031.1 metalloregulator ArsR/SmtB family transcription factor [Streptomyces marispadix]
MKAPAALADPVRREILVLLSTRPRNVGDITGHFAVSRPAVSRHLRVLREAGLVVAEDRGRERIYRLEPEPLMELRQWLEQFASRWEQRLDALETEVHRTRRERRRQGRSPAEAVETPEATAQAEAKEKLA